MKKVRFLTLGCKVNQYETQAMREALLRRGLNEEGEGPADVVVVNTCTVTDQADRENRYWIRRLRRENPSAKIVVTGCWVERNRKEIEGLREVDLILSNREKPDLAERLFQGCGTPEVQTLISPSPLTLSPQGGEGRVRGLYISSFQGHGRAFVKIQDGCNHACSFCKVVLVRGRSRSRPLGEIVEESERLAGSGYREIVLTGIQLGAYGADLVPLTPTLSPLRGEGRVRGLVSVLEALSEIPGIDRIRLSSIEPTDVTRDLIEAMKKFSRVCPQLHIPLQSGDSEILKKMNRRYDRGFYQDLIKELRRQIPDFCLSMDVMAGFPGEEERHFQNTLALIEETRPIRVHAFPYSRREGTRAARFEERPPSERRERMKRLIMAAKEVTEREKRNFLGRTFPVLVEKEGSEEGFLEGHTAHYLKVSFRGPREWIGKSIPVRLIKVEPDGITGIREESV